MKFFSFPLSAILVTTAYGQSVAIGAPPDGTTVQPGSNITVEIDRPDTLSGSTEVAVVIGFWVCGESPASVCPPPSDVLGSILYNGPYDPQFHNNGTPPNKPPHQNFTVTIPPTAQSGKAQLGVAHLSLIGAGQFPFLETRNITLNVVKP